MEVVLLSKRATLKLQSRASTVTGEGVNNRAVEAVDALGVPIPMRQATDELIDSHDYDKAANRAGVTADVVRGWAENPLFIAAIGWLIVGLADNQE
jgi:hypothetical protein